MNYKNNFDIHYSMNGQNSDYSIAFILVSVFWPFFKHAFNLPADFFGRIKKPKPVKKILYARFSYLRFSCLLVSC